MACKNPNCNCNHADRDAGTSTGGGFALGVAIGAAAAVLMAPDEGKKIRTKAKQKLDDLTGGRTPEEMMEAVREVVGNVVDDIRESADEGKAEAAKTEEDVMKGKHPVTKSPKRKK